MSGKGSKRRPQQASDADVQASWDRIFGGRRPRHVDAVREANANMEVYIALERLGYSHIYHYYSSTGVREPDGGMIMDRLLVKYMKGGEVFFDYDGDANCGGHAARLCLEKHKSLNPDASPPTPPTLHASPCTPGTGQPSSAEPVPGQPAHPGPGTRQPG